MWSTSSLSASPTHAVISLSAVVVALLVSSLLVSRYWRSLAVTLNAPSVDFPGVAAHCGYRRVASCRGSDGLEKAMAWASDTLGNGPALLHVAIDGAEAKSLERPKLAPPEIATNFRNFLTR